MATVCVVLCTLNPYLLSCPSNQSVERCPAASQNRGRHHWPLSSSDSVLVYSLNCIAFKKVSIVLFGAPDQNYNNIWRTFRNEPNDNGGLKYYGLAFFSLLRNEFLMI